VSRYRDQVAAALQAVTIRGPTQYAWLGRASRRLPASVTSEMNAAERRTYLVGSLREELYWSFYCHGRPVPARWGEPQPVAADPWLEAAMSVANGGRGSWEGGWTVQRLEGEDAIVATPRLRARVMVAECRAVDGALRPGAGVSIRLPKELPAVSPGFYTVVGEAVADPSSSAGAVRAYWNIGRAGAPALVGAITSRLNAKNIPFRLKVADHPLRLDRCDAAVLYLPADTFPALRETLRQVAVALTGRLRPRTPALTLGFAPGVGLAEDDGAGESFGVRRCELLADGIVRGNEQGIAGIGQQLEAMAARFADDGVSVDAPYLDPSLAGQHVL
jgi:hypothetical protein